MYPFLLGLETGPQRTGKKRLNRSEIEKKNGELAGPNSSVVPFFFLKGQNDAILYINLILVYP
jgi:hypothetical protein